MDKLKLKLKQDQDKWESICKKFEADKKLYYIFKNEILKGDRDKDDIPILFKHTYPIFEKIDNDNIINTDKEINIYASQIKQNQNIDTELFSSIFNKSENILKYNDYNETSDKI